VRSFGPPPRKAPIPREPFDFTFLRDDEPEVHHFQARAVVDTATLVMMLSNVRRHPEEAMGGVVRMVGKMLDNKDGTPTGWKPEPWKPERPEGGELPEEPTESLFVGPDGDPIDQAAVDKLATFEAGSSRRRWLHLLEEDDEVIVDASALTKLFEWLVGLAAGRPTPPSS
jgi:hypothetical protein